MNKNTNRKFNFLEAYTYTWPVVMIYLILTFELTQWPWPPGQDCMCWFLADKAGLSWWLSRPFYHSLHHRSLLTPIGIYVSMNKWTIGMPELVWMNKWKISILWYLHIDNKNLYSIHFYTLNLLSHSPDWEIDMLHQLHFSPSPGKIIQTLCVITRGHNSVQSTTLTCDSIAWKFTQICLMIVMTHTDCKNDSWQRDIFIACTIHAKVIYVHFPAIFIFHGKNKKSPKITQDLPINTQVYITHLILVQQLIFVI